MEIKICDCIKTLAKAGFVQPNLLKPDDFYLPQISGGKLGKHNIRINYCPICGRKLAELPSITGRAEISRL